MSFRRVPLSATRRLVAELSRHSLRVPRCLMMARLSLPEAFAARAAGPAPRIPWPVIFAKGWGLVARRDPVLRRFHASLPWPHLLEAEDPAACIVIEREHAGAPAVFFARFLGPDGIPLPEFAARLAAAKTAPEAQERSVRRMLRLARLPWPFRPLAFRYAMATARPLHRYAGTFAVSALGGQGAAILDSVSVLPAFLSYGPIAEGGAVDVHLAFDHRVMDGADGARALRALEAAIEAEVAPELRQLAG